MFFVIFALFYTFFDLKERKKLFFRQKIYFDQRSAWGAPVCWSKYTADICDFNPLLFCFRMAYESHLHSAFWQKNKSPLDGKHDQREEDFDEDCEVEQSDAEDQDDDEEISVT